MEFMRKKDPLLSSVNSVLVELPSPSNLSGLWNFGSLLGLCLIFQVITGVMLSLHYSNYIEVSFSSVVHLTRDVNYGWLLRCLHANGASLFFVCLYVHTGRGMYYGSYRFFHTWAVGVTILFLVMATAFLGYVLPWGQMSFWGATVITNLLSTVPYVGQDLVQWLWGGYAVDGATLTRFFAFHFLLPFIVLGLVVAHIVYLHQTGSNNPTGLRSEASKIPFHPYYMIKDLVGFMVLFFILVLISLKDPYVLSDPENFNPANPLSTPPHIQPEWYYLFAYAILRSIPNKLGGVIALVVSIAILYILPFMKKGKMRTMGFYKVSQVLFWGFVSVSVLLTWIGACPVEDPYVIIGQVLTLLYFSYFLFNSLCVVLSDKVNE